MDIDGDRIRREIERGMQGSRFRANRRVRFPHTTTRHDSAGRDWMPMSRGRLGVTVQSLSPQLADYFGVKDGGALVSSRDQRLGGRKGGLKAGDVITSVNGDHVRDAESLSREIGDASGTRSRSESCATRKRRR